MSATESCWLIKGNGERENWKIVRRINSVVERHAETYTYRIRNCASDQEKVVHRNLVMPVNFLPILSEPEDGSSSVNDRATGAYRALSA